MYKVVFVPRVDTMPDFAADVEGKEFDNPTRALCAARDVMLADDDRRLRLAYVQDDEGAFLFCVRLSMFNNIKIRG